MCSAHLFPSDVDFFFKFELISVMCDFSPGQVFDFRKAMHTNSLLTEFLLYGNPDYLSECNVLYQSSESN